MHTLFTAQFSHTDIIVICSRGYTRARFLAKTAWCRASHQCRGGSKNLSRPSCCAVESYISVPAFLRCSLFIKMECELLKRINTTSPNKQSNLLNSTHLEWESACMPLSLVCEVLISCCWAQRRKELITNSERFTSYYRTTPTVHLLRCAFICLLLY